MTHTSHRRARTPGRRRSVAVASAISVLATAAVVTAGTVVQEEPITVDAAVSAPAEAPAALGLTAADFAEREQRISRSIERQERQERREQRERERRQAERQAERERRAAERAAAAEAERQEQLRSADPRQIAQSLMPEYGLSSGEFSCLDQLWQKESEWDATAANPTSSAYGIPQALPGSKMSSAGADWETNPATQIRWGLGYIRDRYGSACAAWGHSQANNWY